MFNNKSKYNIAIVGATGIVGESLLDILYSRKFPADKIVPLASKRSAGSQVKFGSNLLDVITLNDFERCILVWWENAELHIVTLWPCLTSSLDKLIHLIGRNPSSICKGSPVCKIQIFLCIHNTHIFNRSSFFAVSKKRKIKNCHYERVIKNNQHIKGASKEK